MAVMVIGRGEAGARRFQRRRRVVEFLMRRGAGRSELDLMLSGALPTPGGGERLVTVKKGAVCEKNGKDEGMVDEMFQWDIPDYIHLKCHTDCPRGSNSQPIQQGDKDQTSLFRLPFSSIRFNLNL